jgi:hypothetical protein
MDSRNACNWLEGNYLMRAFSELQQDDYFGAGRRDTLITDKPHIIYCVIDEIRSDFAHCTVVNGLWDICFERYTGKSTTIIDVEVLYTDDIPPGYGDYNSAIKYMIDKLTKKSKDEPLWF